MTDAERQARRRARQRPPFDAGRMARDIATELDEDGDGEDQLMLKALIAALACEVAAGSFVARHVTEDWISTVTVTVDSVSPTPV
jgi:hypothetical protein